MALIQQTGSYIPIDDPGARQWLNNFAGIVASDPAAVGLTQADADTLTDDLSLGAVRSAGAGSRIPLSGIWP